MKNSIVFLLCLFLVSCNYLDVVPDDTPTIDHAFQNRYQAEGFLYGCFGYLPDFAYAGTNPALLGGDEVWYIDPVDGMDTRCWYIARGNQQTTKPIADYWQSKQNEHDQDLGGGRALFTALSDCNIFLENIHKPFDLKDRDRIRWIAEVKFFKAYYHFWLLRAYGPIPLIKENLPVSATGEDAQRYREPIDNCVTYICELLDEAVKDLPVIIDNQTLEMGRPTKAIALAVKAQVLTLAASPIFNGNEDYVDFQDLRGVRLFPQKYEQAKWETARDAIWEAIQAAHNAGHALYDFKLDNPTLAGSLNEKTVLAMQVRGAATERWNSEIIWGDAKTHPGELQRSCHPVFNINQSHGNLRKTYAPPLRIVEQFYTKNGVPIEEDKDWLGVNPMEIKTATTDDRYYIEPNYQTIRLHFDREARFYGSITFDGGTFYGNGKFLTDDKMWVTDLKNGQPGGDISTTRRYSSTGYLVKKLIHFRTEVPETNDVITAYQYAFPIIRLADLYLLYAEALNECSAAPTSGVYEYIDKVRERSGLDGVVKSWDEHAIDASKPLSQNGMREIIRRERMIELAFEGARFWDLKRWKLAKEYMNKPIRGLNIVGETPADFYQVREVYPLKYELKDYLWPIKQSVLLNNPKLVQNPGW